MKRVVVFTTDGSIPMKDDPLGGGAVPSQRGGELLTLLPRDSIDIAFEEFSNLPSSHFLPAKALELAQRIESALMAPDVDGVVVTHGTDTLEETAYLLDLTVHGDKPIVCTGSMRQLGRPGYDGVGNLANAIRLAVLPEARGMGILVVFGDRIYAASEVHSLASPSCDAFHAPGSGPLGHIDARQVWLHHRPLRRQYIPCTRLVETVDLIRLTQGADDRLLRHSIDDGVAGIVIEVFGSGRVPPWWLPTINEALSRRIVVAVTSRCGVGSLGDDHGYVGAYHDLRRLGVLLVNYLNGNKTRIKLMVALGAARNTPELRRWFEP
jgi:L-asparaginase